MRLAGSRKAVSTVIATLLMINIAFTTGILVFAWAQGVFGSWASTSGMYFQTKGEDIEEAIALVNLRFLAPASSVTYTLNITARNIGHRDVWIASIYFNETNVMSQVSLAWNNDGATVSAIGSGLHAGKYHVRCGDGITFAFGSITAPVISNGNLLSVVVATDRGNQVSQQWKVTG